MKTILISLVFVTGSFTVHAQKDSTRSAMDYIKQREQTDPNMNGLKRSKLKAFDSTRLINSKGLIIQTSKKDKL